MRISTVLVTLIGLSALGMAGCSEGPVASQDDGLHVVFPGKADNYYSNVAAEYELTGKVAVAMTRDEFDDETLRARKIGGRLTAVGLYLTTYLTDKFRGIDINGDGEISEDEVFFHNEEYGGFHAMVRNYSLETEDVETAEDGYLVTFTVDVAGPPTMLSAIPGEWDDEEQGLRFGMQMPEGMSISEDYVPRGEIRRFDPAEYDGELETIEFLAKVHEEIADAWPHFAEFMSDGVFDITMFYGHDYNESRSDLRGARDAFNELFYKEFDAPVASFEELAADSGPFTKTVLASGSEVRIEVRIFHSDMFVDAREQQHDLALSEVASRDVFFYNGHAGPYYGFYLDADGEAKVDYREFSGYPLPADRQQLVIAQGCQTYSQYADMIYANPDKSEDNLDVITTVNYSYGSGTLTILRNLIKTDYLGRHQPVAFYQFIRDLNNDWINSWRDVFYGVMGIDGNPQLHPYANTSSIGIDCQDKEDCGDPSAHVCLDIGQDRLQCGAITLSSEACPEGSQYLQLANGSSIVSGACF